MLGVPDWHLLGKCWVRHLLHLRQRFDFTCGRLVVQLVQRQLGHHTLPSWLVPSSRGMLALSRGHLLGGGGHQLHGLRLGDLLQPSGRNALLRMRWIRVDGGDQVRRDCDRLRGGDLHGWV